MKIILISIIFFTNLFSDSLMIIKNNVRVNWCITDSYYFDVNNIYFYNAYDPTIKSQLSKQNVVEIKPGYEYNPTTAICDLNTSNPETPTNPTPDVNGLIMGMKETDFHLSMAFWGICLSFLMSIGLIISF